MSKSYADYINETIETGQTIIDHYDGAQSTQERRHSYDFGGASTYASGGRRQTPNGSVNSTSGPAQCMAMWAS
jgi:hypothetical protein